ncbi:MAG: HXXEE domain-containing protein, partial [Candidatus Methylomirabilaceae bacterium]
MEWVYWAIVGAAFIHIAEEYWGGFLIWFPKFTGLRMTRTRFVIVNTLFVVLCVLAAISGQRRLVFSLSVAALIFINAIIHIVGTVRFRRYSPGLVSALLLYIPLAVYAYSRSAAAGLLTGCLEFYEKAFELRIVRLYRGDEHPPWAELQVGDIRLALH